MSVPRAQLSRFMAVFAGGTLISRVLGLVRDGVLGYYVPAASRDAFFLAFQLPNMLRDMLGEGAANAALIPVFTRRLEQDGEAGYRRSVRAVLGVFIVLFAVVTLVGVLVTPYVPHAVELLRQWSGGEAKAEEQWQSTVAMMQWLFPYLFFIGLTAFATAPLFIARHYFTPSWTPALLNVALIAGCVAPAAWFGGAEWGLVAGVWVGGIAQMGVMFWAMRRRAGVLMPSFAPRHPDVARVFLLLGPVVLGQTAGEINKLVDRFFAYSLEADTVTALYYSNRLIQLPLALFGIGVSVAILPTIAQALARDDAKTARDTLMLGLRQSFFLLAPATMGLMMLGEPVIRILFERGEFTSSTTAMTNTAMFYYAGGLLAFGWIKVTAQGFYAAQDTRTPVTVAALSMLLNIALNFALVPSMGYRGLALATTISFGLNFAALYVLLTLRYGRLFDFDFALDIVKTVAASAVAVVAAGLLLGPGMEALPRGMSTSSLVGAIVLVAALMVAGGCYFAVAFALRIPEARDLWDALRRRVGKAG